MFATSENKTVENIPQIKPNAVTEEATQTSVAEQPKEPTQPTIRITLPAATNGEVSIERFGQDIKTNLPNASLYNEFINTTSLAEPVKTEGSLSSKMVVHLDPLMSMGSQSWIGLPTRVMVTVEFSDGTLGSYQKFSNMDDKKHPHPTDGILGHKPNVQAIDAAVSARNSKEAINENKGKKIQKIIFQ